MSEDCTGNQLPTSPAHKQSPPARRSWVLGCATRQGHVRTEYIAIDAFASCADTERWRKRDLTTAYQQFCVYLTAIGRVLRHRTTRLGTIHECGDYIQPGRRLRTLKDLAVTSYLGHGLVGIQAYTRLALVILQTRPKAWQQAPILVTILGDTHRGIALD